MHRLFALLLILILCNNHSALGQELNYQYTSISVAEGLSQSTVKSMLLDNKGKLWIGTKNGLNFYTGQSLKIFESNPAEEYSLPSNNIIHIAQDSLGNIWISTQLGLVTYNERQGDFQPVNKNIIYSSLCVKGGILLGSDNQIYKYDYKKQAFDSVSINPQNTSGNDATKYKVLKMMPYSDKEVLVATRRDGLYLLNCQTFQLKKFLTYPSNILQGICLSSNGYIYLSYWGQGLYCYDKTGKFIKRYMKHNSGLSYDYILDIIESNGYLWLATDGGGINRLKLDNDQFYNLYHIAGDENSLPVNSINLLYKDNNGYLWAGSVRGGVFSIKESYIRTYKDSPLGYNNGLSEKAVTSLYEEPEGKLWIGTDGGGINMYESQTGNFKHFPSTYGDKILSIAPVSDKELMVSVYTKGLFLFEKGTGQYKRFVVVNDSVNLRQCFYGYIPRAHRVTEDKIYILSKDIWVYNIKEKKFSPIHADKEYQLQASVMAYSDENMSLVMRLNDVFRINNQNDNISLLFQLDENELITSIDYDGLNNIWVGTTAGMGYYDIKTKKYTPIKSQLFNEVSSLRYDPSEDRLWICAQNHLFSYCIKDNKFIQWNRSDGFQPNEIIFTYQPKIEKSNRYIYFGGIEGLVQISTDIPEPHEPLPVIELYNVELNGQPFTSDDDIRNISIPWNYNTLALQIYIKDQDIFQRVAFRYIIKGDANKIIESYDPTLVLSSLTPGNYSIDVACMTKDGSYTQPIHLTDIHITPPWYKTTWFILLCLICIAGGLAASIFYFNKKKEVRMQKRLKEYRQYLNEKKIDFLIHINHELRTPLTLIYAPLKRLMDNNETQQVPQYLLPQLQLLFNQAQHMREIVDMVLDWNSLEDSYSKLNVQRNPLNEWIKEVISDFENEAKEKGITLKIETDPQIDEVWYDKQKCKTVLSNLLMNALKFSTANSSITVSTQIIDGKVRISVIDEGCGIKDLDMAKLFTRFYKGNNKEEGSGFGLYYAKTIMEMHGGNIGAYNNTEKGATFYMELPLINKDEKEEPATLQPEQSPITTIDTIENVPFDCSEKTVLIVEDEDELREYLADTLKDSYKKVYSANNAITALEICREKQPSIIVSDVMMPKMDGFEFCREVKNDIQISHIPVILLTARYDHMGITTGYKSGADAYLPKPFDVDALKTVIENILRNRDQIRQQYITVNQSTSPQTLTNSKADEDFMKKANAIIHTHLSEEDFAVQTLADTMGMSRSSLYNKIKIITGLGVNDYINRLRIEEAMSLLINTNLNINEIAGEVGFAYPRYFSSTFKQMKGMTPKQFREGNMVK